jgi:hypothetical protein
MNTPNPALVAQSNVRRLPRLALVCFVLTYVMSGFWGREPWKTIDMGSLGIMLDLAHGAAPWAHPSFLGQAPQAPALLPYWLGAIVLQAAPAGWDAVVLTRIPYVMMLMLTLYATWRAIELLALSPAAQPVVFAFGGEARPRDYARTMADAGLLALMGCLGLAQASHEVTPMAMQLCMNSVLFCGLAGLSRPSPSGHLALVVVGLWGLALSGAPTLALCMAASACLVLLLDPETRAHRARSILILVCTGLLMAWVAQSLQLWQFTWRGLPGDLKKWISLFRLWVWFLWPAWPLAFWSLWVWRKSWLNARPSRHVLLPLVMTLPVILATLFTSQEERALLLILPFMAALSVFALPTLRRSVSALIDWFTLIFFSSSALIIWIIWLAGVTGWPPQPASNLARLLPGLSIGFSWPAFALALAGTWAWIAVVMWRVGRHRSVLWKSLVMPASGATLCWLLLMTLWMPMLDYARSYAPLVRNVAVLMGHPDCVQVQGLSQAQLAALQYHGQMDIDLKGDMACQWLVVGMRSQSAFESSPEAGQWRHVQNVRRPTDHYENLVIYQRQKNSVHD